MNPALLTLAMIGAVGCVLAIIVAASSRHRKSGTGDVRLIGEAALVNTKLDPEGTILIHGELWRACSKNGRVVDQRNQVTVVAVRGHLLLVEPMCPKL